MESRFAFGGSEQKAKKNSMGQEEDNTQPEETHVSFTVQRVAVEDARIAPSQCDLQASCLSLSDGSTLRHLRATTQALVDTLDPTSPLRELQQHTDLQPGVYEGGFKLWEGALDLVEYLGTSHMDVSNARVAEIGCGHGLPGIYCLRAGASVLFQDYNEEVLRIITIPTAVLNVGMEGVTARGEFIAGEWGAVSNALSQERTFDVLLASEVLYNPQAMHLIHQFLIRHLARPAGIALISSKTYYFGVGGGVCAFEELVKEHGLLHVETVRTFQDGMSNVRQILRVSRKEDQ